LLKDIDGLQVVLGVGDLEIVELQLLQVLLGFLLDFTHGAHLRAEVLGPLVVLVYCWRFLGFLLLLLRSRWRFINLGWFLHLLMGLLDLRIFI
jgi:hypothetical protein